jgi:hypothetical protein
LVLITFFIEKLNANKSIKVIKNDEINPDATTDSLTDSVKQIFIVWSPILGWLNGL